MLIQELHLQVLQRLQEVGSYKRSKFRSEEIDLALNKAMYRLLEEGVENQFQDSQINLSHVSALIHKNKISEVIQPQTTDKQYEENLAAPNAYSVIPPDLYWLINGRVEAISDPLNCSTAPTLAKTDYYEYVAVVPWPTESTPYFASTSVTSSVRGSLYTSPTAISAGFNDPKAKFVIVGDILDTCYRLSPTLQVYWERYRDTYYENSLIFVGSTSIGTITLTSNSQVSAVTQTLGTYRAYNRALISALASKTIHLIPVRANKEAELYPTLKNSYYKSNLKEVVMDQTMDYFIFYPERSFIVTRFYYDYIRKPKTISLILNQGCELASTAHPKVVDLAVEILKLDTNSQSYPATVQDTQNRTV